MAGRAKIMFPGYFRLHFVHAVSKNWMVVKTCMGLRGYKNYFAGSAHTARDVTSVEPPAHTNICSSTPSQEKIVCYTYFSSTAMTMIYQHSSLLLTVPIMLKIYILTSDIIATYGYNCYWNTLGGGAEKHPQRYRYCFTASCCLLCSLCLICCS